MNLSIWSNELKSGFGLPILFRVHHHTLPDRVHSLQRVQKLVHRDILVLVLLIVLEEAPDLLKAMGGQLRDVPDMRILGIVQVHADDFIVLFTMVDHLHQPDGSHLQE